MFFSLIVVNRRADIALCLIVYSKADNSVRPNCNTLISFFFLVHFFSLSMSALVKKSIFFFSFLLGIFKNFCGLVWFVGFYGITTFVDYLTPNPFLCK